MSQKVVAPRRGSNVDAIVARLRASPSVSDQRKARDLKQLATLSRGAWKGRFEILGFAAGEARALVMVGRLGVRGLVYEGGRTRTHEGFTFGLAIPHTFPLSQPLVRFFEPVPWNPHVVHSAAAVDAQHLPAELQEFLRRAGEGNCCYMRSAQWSADATKCHIALVVWVLSRALTGQRTWGEIGALNPGARDEMFQMHQDGRLPLGPSLPFPHADATRRPDGAESAEPAPDEDAIEWDEGGQQDGTG